MLSVIIPTRNRAALLAKAFLSIRDQTLPQEAFEVIVVDNGSSDETPSLCTEVQSWFRNFAYSRVDAPGLHIGRHCGMRMAKGEILVYADDDIQAEPSWLSAIAGAFEKNDIALVGGKCIPDYEASPPDWTRDLWTFVSGGQFNAYFSLADFGESAKDIPSNYVFGCNYSIRKSVLDKAGGFHPDGMPKELRHLRGDGETAVSKAVERMGFRARYEPRATVRHFVSRRRMTLDYVFERAFAQGISDSYTWLRKTREFGINAAIRAAVHTSKVVFAANHLNKRSPCQRAMLRGYHTGFIWHHLRAMRDPALRAWIVKDTYINED
jgi:glycosyltransferase involved in cell wall biosynthesis